MLDILEGKPVPSIVSVPHEGITKDNIDKWFPEGGKPTAAVENPTLTQNPGDPSQERYWVKYNFDTGAFEVDPTVTADPRSWKPNLRQAPEGTVICFTAESEEFAWDTVYVNPSMDEAGKKTGAKILRFNNAYPSTSQPLANADACVTAGAKGVVSFNVFEELSPAIMEKYNANKMPTVAIDVVHPGSIFFGADNCRTGELAAEFGMQWAKEHNWPENEMYVVTGSDPAVGGAPTCRQTAFVDKLKKDMPNIPAANYFDVDMRTATEGVTAGALSAMTDWLTAHPDAKYILSTTINDDRAVGIANAMTQAGRGDPTVDGIVIGKNADEAGLAAVRRPDTPYVGTVAFFGQLYGEWATGLMLDILEGKPVPSIVSVPHEVITKDNIDKWFPEGGK
jgi:ribose transport system substrate-binding protein